MTQKLLARATSHTALERVHGAREVFPAAGGLTTLGSTVDEGRIAGLALLGDPETRPTAVIAQSDLLAVGVIRAAAELGLAVPGDLSVVGFDGVRIDDPVAAELTTMVQPGFAKGQAAGRGILELLAGREGRSVSFTSAFRRGATTAPPR